MFSWLFFLNTTKNTHKTLIITTSYYFSAQIYYGRLTEISTSHIQVFICYKRTHLNHMFWQKKRTIYLQSLVHIWESTQKESWNKGHSCVKTIWNVLIQSFAFVTERPDQTSLLRTWHWKHSLSASGLLHVPFGQANCALTRYWQ